MAALGGVPAQGVGERKQPEQGLQQLPAKHALALLVAADEGGIAGAQLARLAAGTGDGVFVGGHRLFLSLDAVVAPLNCSHPAIPASSNR